jgi:predicted alpha/beta hydrolase
MDPAMTSIPVASADGARSELVLDPAADPAAPATLILPALGVAARHYARLAAALAARGVTAARVDWRGGGASDRRASRAVDWGYEDLVLRDLPAAITALRGRLPGVPLFLLGHSLGGQVALLHAARVDDDLAGIALVACGTPYAPKFGALRPLLHLLAAIAGPLGGALGHFPGDRLGFGGRQARTLMREWAQLARTGRFASGEDELRRVRARVLALPIAGDRYAPPAAVEHLLEKIPHADVTRARVARELGHLGWLRQPDEVVERVVSWVGSVQRAAA